VESENEPRQWHRAEGAKLDAARRRVAFSGSPGISRPRPGLPRLRLALAEGAARAGGQAGEEVGRIAVLHRLARDVGSEIARKAIKESCVTMQRFVESIHAA
jgi:hypothetical protein